MYSEAYHSLCHWHGQTTPKHTTAECYNVMLAWFSKAQGPAVQQPRGFFVRCNSCAKNAKKSVLVKVCPVMNNNVFELKIWME